MEITDFPQAEGIQAVVKKAWDDEGFKNALVANPRSALAQEGYDLPQEMDLVITDQSDPETFYFVIPNEEQFKKHANEKLEDMELTDEQLETVSGGEIVLITSLIWVGVGVAATAGGAYGLGYASEKTSQSTGW